MSEAAAPHDAYGSAAIGGSAPVHPSRRRRGRYGRPVIQVEWLDLAVVLVCLVYGVALRQRGDTSPLGSRTAWEGLLSFAGDRYLLLFFVVPWHLFRQIRQLPGSGTYSRLIRAGSIRAWLRGVVTEGCASTLGLTLLWLAAGAASVVGASPRMRPAARWASSGDDLLKALSPTGVNVAVLVGLQTMMVFSLLVLMRAVLALAFVVTRSQGWLALMALALWVEPLMEFVVSPTKSYGILGFLTIEQAVQVMPWWAAPLVAPAAALLLWALSGWLGRGVERRDRIVGWGAHVMRRPGVLHIVGVALIVVAIVPTVTRFAASPWALVVAATYGTSSNGVHPLLFASAAIINIGFAYVVSVELAGNIQDRLPYLLIRGRGPVRWLTQWLCGIAGVALGLSVFVVAWASALGFLLHPTSSSRGGDALAMSPAILYQATVNGTLQLVVYALALFVVYWWRRSGAWMLVVVALIFACMLPASHPGHLLPVALGSTGLIADGFTPWHLSVVLAITIVLLTLIAVAQVTRTDRAVQERS